MIGFGGTLMVIGILGMFGSFGIDVSAPGTSSLVGGRGVANIDAMSMREMTTIAFGFVFLAGAVFTASGALANKLTDLPSRGANAGENRSDQFPADHVPSASADRPAEVHENPDGTFTYRDRTFRQRSSAEDYKKLLARRVGS